jgi:Peptidase A4 family/Putative Ig domain
VVALTTSTKHLESTGGSVTLKARVRSAKTCTFTETRGTTVVATKSVACSKGSASATLASAPSRTTSAVTLRFAVRAGTSLSTVTVVQDGVAPVSVVPTAGLTPGIVGSSYSTTLLAGGGLAPYTWTLVSGALPAGLTLAADGTVSGTPAAQAQTTIGVQVTDALGQTATGTFTVSVTNPATTDEHSSNWSGYIYRGGPFTSVTGTFNVPTAAAGAGTDVAEWVGIDGDSNNDLIQAGVAETVSGFSGRAQIYAWWEILPASETPISMPVNAGDRMTVTIGQTAAAGLWTIKIVDNTNGQSFQTLQSYSGALTSAEWILEAPTSGRGAQLDLATFSPNVTFTQLVADGPVTEIASVAMVQGDVVATPSSRSANGFSVGYGSAAPDAP